MVASFCAGHLADEHLLPERRDDRDHQHGRQRGQNSRRHRAVVLGLVAQRAPGRRTGAVDRADDQLGREAAEDRRRAVEPERQGQDAGRAAVTGRQQTGRRARRRRSRPGPKLRQDAADWGFSSGS